MSTDKQEISSNSFWIAEYNKIFNTNYIFTSKGLGILGEGKIWICKDQSTLEMKIDLILFKLLTNK